VPARAWLAEFDEAETVGRLLVAFREWQGRSWPSDNAILAGVERLLEDRATQFLLAAPDDDSAPIGIAQLRYRHSIWMAAEDCWLEDVFVIEPARRQGVGAALVELALEQARERGCRRVELDVAEANEGALALYRRYGFSESSKSSGSRDLFLGLRLDDPA
jgi:GNAT superfamily N-acetyltransferase